MYSEAGANEYPQSMFWSRKKKNNVYPCKPQFYYIKVGFKGVRIIYSCFRDVTRTSQDLFSQKTKINQIRIFSAAVMNSALSVNLHGI